MSEPLYDLTVAGKLKSESNVAITFFFSNDIAKGGKHGEKRQILGVFVPAVHSHFEMLCHCYWEPDTAQWLLNSSKVDPE